MGKTRTIIADDHPMFLLGLRTMLEAEGSVEVVATAEDGAEAVDKVRELEPEVALLDIMMPVMSGTEAATIIKNEYPDTGILMLSADTTQATVEQLLGIGVDGFISKFTTGREILNAVKTVAAGYNYFGADIATIIERLHSAKNVGDSIFTPRELDVIRLSCEGLQYKEIADRLMIKTKTVDNIKSNIFHKLGINNTVELVRYAIQKGIISL